jgi:hypothetical protein
MIWYDAIYLLTAIRLPPSGSKTVHIYTQKINRTTQNKQYIEQHKNFGRVRAIPRLGELYPGICLTTEEKTRKNLSQGSLSGFLYIEQINEHLISVFFFKLLSLEVLKILCQSLQRKFQQMYKVE